MNNIEEDGFTNFLQNFINTYDDILTPKELEVNFNRLVNNITGKQIFDIFLDQIGYNNTTREYDKNEFYKWFNDENNVEVIYSYGGFEGAGEEWFEVLYFKKHDVYLEHYGAYYSYDGVTVETEYYRVEPVKVTVTEYKRIKD